MRAFAVALGAATTAASAAAAAPSTTLHAIAYTALSSGSNGLAVANITIEQGKAHFSLSETFGVLNAADPNSGSWASLHKEWYNLSAAFWSASVDYVQAFQLNGFETEVTNELSAQGWFLNSASMWGREMVGVGELGDGNFTMISVNVDTGNVHVYGADAGNYVTSPQGVGGVAPPAYSSPAKHGSYSFLTTVETNNNAVIATFDLERDVFITPDISYPGSLTAITPYAPTGSKAGTAGMLALGSPPNGSDLYLLAWGQDRAAAPKILLTVNASYGAAQSNMVFDPSTHTAYALLTGPNTLLSYSLGVFDLSDEKKPTASYYGLAGSAAATYGLCNLVLASQIQ